MPILDTTVAKAIPRSGSLLPSGLTFTTRSIYRPFDILPSWCADIDDGMEFDKGLYATSSTGSPASAAYADGLLTTTFASGTNNLWFRSKVKAPIPYYSVELTVKSMGSGTTNAVYCGLMQDTGNYVLVGYDANASQVVILTNKAGSVVSVNSASKSLTAPFKLTFAMTGAYVTAFVATGDQGPVKIVGGAIPTATWDVADPTVLANLRPSFVLACAASATQVVDRFRCGPFGTVGFQNPTLVKYDDGTPYTIDGCPIIVATNGGLSALIPGVHNATFKYDPGTRTLAEIGKQFVSRSSHIYGDCSGGITVERSTNLMHWFPATWGTYTGSNAVATQYISAPSDILRGIQVLNITGTLNLPGSLSYYDLDALKYDDGDGMKWHMAYAVTATQTGWSTFNAAHAKATNLSDAFTLVGSVTADTGYEGTKWLTIGGGKYVVAGSSGGTWRYYAAATMPTGGSGSVTHDAISPGTIAPHPCIIPVRRNGLTEFHAISFDTTAFSSSWSHGSAVIQKAAETETGYEFPIRRSPY